MTATTRLTLDAFLAMPGIDERRLELIDGEVYEKVSPRWAHGNLAGELYVILRNFGFASVEARAIIPASGDLDASSPLPDLAFYRKARPAPLGWMTNPPDIVVEVLSPGQTRRDLRSKIDIYLGFGIRSIWVFDLERQEAEIYENGERRTLGKDETLRTAVIPGLEIELGQLFEQVGL